jgi:hypothetical protein
MTSNENLKELDNLVISNNQNKFFLELEHFSLKKKKIWIKDELITKCSNCKVNFSFLLRKHHCRYCGNIFCGTCTNYWINIPQIVCDKNEYNKSVDRVCKKCYPKLFNLNKINNLYIIVCNLPLNMIDIANLRLINKKWDKSVLYYLLTIKYLNNNINIENYSLLEKNIIWSNKYLFSGHNNWIMHFIKYVEKYKINNSDLISNILYSSKRYHCKNILCNVNCKEDFSFQNSIICICNGINNSICEKFVLDKLWEADLDEFLYYLPILINKINPSKKNLIDYIISISSHNYNIVNFVFWELSYIIYNNKIFNYCINNIDFYENLRIELVSKIQDETRLHLQNSYYFIENLKKIYDNKDFPILLKSYIHTTKNNKNIDISCPLNPQFLITDINEKEVIIKNSYLKPLIIPFINNKNEVYKLMVKKDDLKKDLIIMNLIKLIDNILKLEENLDLYITTYKILPISKDLGLIEIISNAETIYSINKKYKFSIQNYILENNSHMSIDNVRERFTKSCVSYCILSYLLGIGDRHMENIMIKTTGEIFHIDFGFILGYDPKLLKPEIRITNEMVDAMGGKNSKYYNLFRDLCTKSIICLRKHINMFKLLLGELENTYIDKNTKLSRDYIEKFIDAKFLIGENFDEVKLYLINKIDNRSKIYSDTLIDFCHNSWTKESTSTLSNQAYNYSNSIFNYFYGDN